MVAGVAIKANSSVRDERAHQAHRDQQGNADHDPGEIGPRDADVNRLALHHAQRLRRWLVEHAKRQRKDDHHDAHAPEKGQ